ncbi:hypothetical protein BP6252_10733 [Coleophoma cylindrospora]|uniref:Uncharacterized protein n=1 Tax=Coleophoma cylindrospora TaxID=1849047 RepID=A0A3D8QTI1_9HELO|nr:hypothetical protein BP6252_10733 [Coleophoma cylindrospora]
MLSESDVRKHASRESCWVIIRGSVYDLTSFVDDHPGGAAVILKYAGKDATAAFEPLHPGNTLEVHLEPKHNLGPVAPSAIKQSPEQQPSEARNGAPKAVALQTPKKFKLSAVINLGDFERAASYNLDPKAFAFYRAGADDEKTLDWNRRSWQAVRFRPRVLRPIGKVDLSTSIMGIKFSSPFFISPAGAGKLAHPEGEILMTKAAAKHKVLHWVCNMASCTQLEMAEARAPDQTTFWQIYAMTNLAITEKEIKQAVERGYKGFALTVDAIRAGKRERDLRFGVEEFESPEDPETTADGNTHGGGISATRAPVWSAFDWPSAIAWIRSFTDLPIAIKGIQCWEDAALCMQFGVHPWLSNHGGRQLEGAPSAVETLIEIRQHCPSVFQKCEVIVDGGIMRGTDVVKALALGAKAVGLGRTFLYALSFGEAGVNRAINILQQEVETAMALLGVEKVEDLGPEYVDISAFELRARL